MGSRATCGLSATPRRRPTSACGGRPSRPRASQRAPQDLPSRAADNLFWLGRYTERADWTMRVLRICLSRLQEDSAPRQELRASRMALEILLSKEDGKVPGEWVPTDAVLIEQLARNLMTSADWYYGLPRTLDNIHRVASITRDRLSLEAWRTLNDFYASRRWRADAMPTAMGDSLRLLDDGLRVLAAFHGLTHENMTRNFGWSFLDMGRRLSRAHNLAELLLGMFGKAAGGEDEIRQPAVRAGAGRQLHHLPLALPAGADAAAGARPAAGRREQSAQHRLPARRAAAPHRYAAAIGRWRRPHRGAAHGAVAADAACASPTSPRSPSVEPGRQRAPSLRKLLSEQVATCRAVGRDRAALLQSGREGRAMGPRALAGRAMIYDVSHRTTYAYGKPVLQSEHLVHLTPRSAPRQSVHRHSLLIEPAPSSNIELRGLLRQRQRYPDDRGRALGARHPRPQHGGGVRARPADRRRCPRRGSRSPRKALRATADARYRRAAVRQRVAAYPRRARGDRLRAPVVPAAAGRSWRRRST